MKRTLNILNICEKSVAYRDYHESILRFIKKYTENELEDDEIENVEKLRKINNINYLLEQKKLDFFWRMNRIFQELEYDELKELRKEAKSYEIKRNINEVIKGKSDEKQ